MSARPSKIGRQAVSYLLAPSTIARLTSLSDASGMSRGRIIDRAVAGLMACPRCDGTGREGPSHRDSDPTLAWTTCGRCKGACLVAG